MNDCLVCIICECFVNYFVSRLPQAFQNWFFFSLYLHKHDFYNYVLQFLHYIILHLLFFAHLFYGLLDRVENMTMLDETLARLSTSLQMQ